jgi:hypothetical protein
MGCLKGGVVANVVVPAAEYVRFAAAATRLASRTVAAEPRYGARYPICIPALCPAVPGGDRSMG